MFGWLPDEPVPLARNGFDESRGLRRVIQSAPYFLDRRVDGRLYLDEDIPPPQLVDDVAAGHELTATFNEEDEKVHGAPLEFHRASITPQLVGADIEFEVIARDVSWLLGINMRP